MIKKGDQFFNHDSSEGFEATTDVYNGKVRSIKDFKCIKGGHVEGMVWPSWLENRVYLELTGQSDDRLSGDRKTV